MKAKLLTIPITLILICSTLEALGESADLADAEKIAWRLFRQN